MATKRPKNSSNDNKKEINESNFIVLICFDIKDHIYYQKISCNSKISVKFVNFKPKLAVLAIRQNFKNGIS